jgi:membrane protein YdbS with pleckstrin-like domain
MAGAQTNGHTHAAPAAAPLAREMKVTHVTIRQSLFFLGLKLGVLEFIAALFMLVFFGFVFELELIGYLEKTRTISFFTFIMLVCIKTMLTFYIIADWVDEYYEITSATICHKWGILIKHEQENMLEHLSTVKLEQGILGRIFNYGTLTLSNWASEKDFTLLLIHSPHKYMRIIKQILGGVVDVETRELRERVIDVKANE